MGCPTGVPLGNVTMATRLPACVKFDGSELGGCSVDCKEICVELPLANTKGPVETTGAACRLSDNGSGDGDSDGSGKTPGEGSSGTKPIDGWLDFQPVVGDATGTSVSGAVAKLNKNLGLAFRQLMDGTKRDSNNINSITHSAESFSRDMKTALSHLDRMSNDVFQTKNNGAELLGRVNTSNEYLNAINNKLDSLGSPSTGDSEKDGLGKDYWDYKFNLLYGKLDEMNKGGLNSIQMLLGQMQNPIFGIEGALGTNGMAGNINAMRSTLEQISGKVGGSSGNTTGGTSGGSDLSSSYLKELIEVTGYMSEDVHSIKNALDGSGGSGEGEQGGNIDYNQMPGSGDNPLQVAGGHYQSSCQGQACFFDVAAVSKQYEQRQGELKDKFQQVRKESESLFKYNLSGAAETPKCFDMFSFNGKEYSVCPESGEFWEIMAAVLMFMFYFVAFMILARR